MIRASARKAPTKNRIAPFKNAMFAEVIDK
jgi:hypothetical protein